MRRDVFLDRLTEELRPVARVSAGRAAALWLGCSAIWVAAITRGLGELRPGVGEQMLASPSFFLELALGLGSIVISGRAALHLAVPGSMRVTHGLLASAVALGAWVVVAAIGNGLAAPPASTFMRAHCSLQAVLYALPPLALGLWLARRRMPLSRAASGLLIGAVAGALPALAMAVACLYGDPAHVLEHHFLLPIAGLAIVGALAGRLVFPRL